MEWWSWTSFFAGVAISWIPSGLAVLWFLLRAPDMDENTTEENSSDTYTGIVLNLTRSAVDHIMRRA